MASAPQANLPLFYKDLMPLNSRDHGGWKSKGVDKAPWLGNQHAVPLTVDEFGQASRHFPIIFSSGDNPVPLCLMGLNEGINTFFDETGQAVAEDFYVPAYARRYPFLLAKLDSKSDNMSLCFDPSAGLVGEFKEGEELFKDGQPTDHTQGILTFCRHFEEAGQRTAQFIEELQKHELLQEGEVAIARGDAADAPPYVYRGFSMVNQEKFRELRGDVLRTWNQNGMLPLVFAHLLSLDLMRTIFARQTGQGKGPGVEQAAAIAAEASPAAKTKK
jgi:hypothetical protein